MGVDCPKGIMVPDRGSSSGDGAEVIRMEAEVPTPHGTGVPRMRVRCPSGTQAPTMDLRWPERRPECQNRLPGMGDQVHQ